MPMPVLNETARKVWRSRKSNPSHTITFLSTYTW